MEFMQRSKPQLGAGDVRIPKMILSRWPASHLLWALPCWSSVIKQDSRISGEMKGQGFLEQCSTLLVGEGPFRGGVSSQCVTDCHFCKNRIKINSQKSEMGKKQKDIQNTSSILKFQVNKQHCPMGVVLTTSCSSLSRNPQEMNTRKLLLSSFTNQEMSTGQAAAYVVHCCQSHS